MGINIQRGSGSGGGAGGFTSINGGFLTDRYYSGPVVALHGSGTVVISVNRLYGTAFHVGETTTFTRIGIEVTTLVSSGNCRLGIYDFDSGKVNALVLDAGVVSTASTGEKEITISQSLSPGMYAIVQVYDLQPTVLAFGVGDAAVGGMIYGNAITTANAVYAIHGSFAYAVLTDPAPTMLSVLQTITGVPAIWLRKV